MKLDIVEIRKIISKISFVKQIYNIEQKEFSINGKFEIAFDELDGTLDFTFEISPQYPLKTYNSESITFSNKDLISFSHVMETGNVCIHTSHSIDLEQKINIDFNSLKEWISKYYISKNKDQKYEHIIVNESTLNDQYYAYVFTNTETTFNKGEFGDVNLSFLNLGYYKEKNILNFIVKEFIPVDNNSRKCQWSNIYEELKSSKKGYFYFMQETPAFLGKFAFNSWPEIAPFISQEFLNLLHSIDKESYSKNKGEIIPLFLGYKINLTEIHWQVSMLQIGNFPLIGIPEIINGSKTGRWNSQLIDEKISWGITRNSSYKYFFGRGTLCEKLISSKILIIGVGAIGSLIATTLTRGGCQFIDFVDYDVKEPENVCRSEYLFINGITNKTDELRKILRSISPFVNNIPLNNNYFEFIFKWKNDDKIFRQNFVENINKYDVIFDCSTDNDLMYVLDSLDLKTELINISITNHAKELVCAFYPNIYRFVNNQFSYILNNDIVDLYSPTGCWSPTYKASHNDINVLVQLAIKQINKQFQQKCKKNNFVIKEDITDSKNLKIVEF